MMHSVFNELKENDEIEIIPINRRRSRCSCPYCEQGGIRNEDGCKVHCCPHKNCGKTYRKTSHLKVHLRSHSGEKPYKCNWTTCDREFSRSDELIRHTRTHTLDKRYHCDKCDKKFMRSDHLQKHLKTHSKDSKLKSCPHCHRKFLRPDNFELHLETHLFVNGETEKEVFSAKNVTEHFSSSDTKQHFLMGCALMPTEKKNPKHTKRTTKDSLTKLNSGSTSEDSDDENPGPEVEQIIFPSTEEDGYLEEPE